MAVSLCLRYFQMAEMCRCTLVQMHVACCFSQIYSEFGLSCLRVTFKSGHSQMALYVWELFQLVLE